MEKDLIICKICGKQSTRIYGAHLKSHGLTSDEYLKLYPGSKLYTESDNKKTTINSGKHMREEKYKKMFSEKIKGENNPNSKSKTTEEERRKRSPFSKDFVGYKDEKEAIEFQQKIKKSIKPEQRIKKIEYWVKKGYSEEESRLIISDKQKTFSLKKCIEKYGEEKGKEIWLKRQEKWQKSLLKNGNMKCGYSEISQKLFYDIINNYDIEDRKNVYFATKNQEYFLSKKGNFFQYDFTDNNKNKIIEYNSDMYHANPIIYKSEDNPHPYRKWLTSKDIWKHDEEKLKMAEENGFEIFVVWDSDYRKNPDKILSQCLEFLK